MNFTNYQHFLDITLSFINKIDPVTSTVALAFAVLAWLVYSAHKAQRIDWIDMITTFNGTKRIASTTKILQILGGIVGTWIVVRITLEKQMSWDIFSIYLAYVASIDGFEKLIMVKYAGTGSIATSTGMAQVVSTVVQSTDDSAPAAVPAATNVTPVAAATGAVKPPDIN